MVNETNKDVILENMMETEVELANPPTNGSLSVLADPDPEDSVEAYISTYEIGRGWDMEDKLEYALRDIEDAVASLQTDKADVVHAHDGYASSDHTHTEYVSASELVVLEDEIDTKADANHTHTDYALQTSVDSSIESLETAIDGKADIGHSHTDYALASHTHDEYSEVGHSHSNYSETTHNHNDSYSLLTHTHTASEIGASDSGHNHDSDYADINHNHDLEYANLTHNHDSSYDALGAASNALTSANTYADELIADEVTNRNSAIATAKSSAISTASSDATTKANNTLASAKTYTDTAVATAKNDLLNGAGTAYDTLKELGDLIDDNANAIEALETIASGKANATHTHAISDITNLQSTLDGKAATSHGTHVTYSTTTPVMDGTASVGTASTVARSDHKHPIDTSRASQTDLDALETVVAGKANSSHTHTIANITNLQTTLDGKAASEHTHSYAGSSSVGGSATSAVKLDSSAGSATQPVYFANGVPVATTYTLGKSVPSSAVFTDTIYTHPSYTARTGVPTANATLSHGGTFTVSQPVCDATGHITAINTRTYTLPTDNNTDTKVTNTLATTTKAYVTGTISASTNTGTQVFDTGVYLDTTAGKLTATTFNGTTFSGSGVATVSEVETYLGI